MKTTPHRWEVLDKLILVAGHAVYIGDSLDPPERDEHWVLKGFQKGEPPQYIEHVRFGVELAISKPNSLLVFSGGQTRSEAGPRSEGQSYWVLADHFLWWGNADVRSRATTEEFARDSLENFLFGIARFRESTGHYPESIEIVGWKFKSARFDLHRRAVRWPDGDRFTYHGVNNPPDLDTSRSGEAKVLAAFTADPFGTETDLLEKRSRRNPFLRQHPYTTSCPEIAALLSHETRDGTTFDGTLPWSA
jgi:hypothetical protein